jgi:hypothetical protein
VVDLCLFVCLGRAQHGGGYTYRLAPANGTLDETSFNQLPLPFVGPQMLRWGGGTSKGGRQLSFNGTYVTGDAVVPPGSMWAKIPIPLVQEGVTQAYPMAPGCAELWGDRASAMCAGMGDGSSAVPTLEIVDRVRIPERTPPGEWLMMRGGGGAVGRLLWITNSKHIQNDDGIVWNRRVRAQLALRLRGVQPGVWAVLPLCCGVFDWNSHLCEVDYCHENKRETPVVDLAVVRRCQHQGLADQAPPY